MKFGRPDWDSGDIHIPEDEPVFLLRAQDPIAAEIVRCWAAMCIDPSMRFLAYRQADRMDNWSHKHKPNLPDTLDNKEIQVGLFPKKAELEDTSPGTGYLGELKYPKKDILDDMSQRELSQDFTDTLNTKTEVDYFKQLDERIKNLEFELETLKGKKELE